MREHAICIDLRSKIVDRLNVAIRVGDDRVDTFSIRAISVQSVVCLIIYLKIYSSNKPQVCKALRWVLKPCCDVKLPTGMDDLRLHNEDVQS